MPSETPIAAYQETLLIPEAPLHEPAGAPVGLIALLEGEKLRLAEAFQELLAHGSILGLDAGRSGLYHWCRQHFEGRARRLCSSAWK